MSRAYHIETYGCQMNVLDSDIVGGVLSRAGYRKADGFTDADVIFLNTCAVRDGAESRVIRRLEAIAGDLRAARRKAVLGLLGCVAQGSGEELIERAPFLDLVVGTDRYGDLPTLIETAVERREPLVDIAVDPSVNYDGEPRMGPSGVTGFVAAMRGCDMGCTFCIVPRTRGEERSRRPLDVLREVRWLVARGVKEVTLLGQKVNAYKWEDAKFADLLRMVAEVPGVERVRYTSPHPLWFTRKLVQAMASHPRICPSVHLPLQSGSDVVLERMKRGYTSKRFARIVRDLRTAMPDVGVTTDIIVGFPGETEDDHQKTLELVRTAQFDSAFMFAYSPRPQTEAAEMPDQLPEDVKKRRLREVIDVQESITASRNADWVGREVEILVERVSKKRDDEFFGRTPENQPVVVPGTADLVGQILRVRVTDSYAHTLRGEIIAREGADVPLKEGASSDLQAAPGRSCIERAS